LPVVVARVKNYNGSWDKMDEEFKVELQRIIEHLLKSDSLVLKKINSKDLRGVELKEYIDQYFKLFQSDTLPQAQSIYESTIDKQMSILIARCVDHYKELIVKNQDLLAEENLHIFHDMAKNKTLIMYKDEKKMGNSDHERRFKAVLEETLDKLFTEWKDRTLKSFEQIKEEKAKTEAAILEKAQLEKEAMEAEIRTQQQLQELENQKKLSAIEQEKYDAQKKLLDARLEAEKERARAVEAERDAQKAWREVLEQKLIAERLANQQQQQKKKRFCSVM
jgi:hypothetical protein